MDKGIGDRVKFKCSRGPEYYALTGLVTLGCATMVILMRFGVIPSVISVASLGMVFSMSDFFTILGAGLCGYHYGVAMFILIFTVEFFFRGDSGMSGLFALFLYLVTMMLSSYITKRRWYLTRKRTAAAVAALTLEIGSLWYLIFVVLANNGLQDNIYQHMGFFRCILGAFPQVAAAVLLLRLFFGHAPELLKWEIGEGYRYTKSYDTFIANSIFPGNSVIGARVTVLSLCEAVILSLFAVLFSDYQMKNLPNSSFPEGRELLIINLQFILLIMSVSLPIATIFNEIIHLIVVYPIDRIALLMNRYACGDEQARKLGLMEAEKLKIRSHDEIENLHNSVKKLFNDVENHIDAVKREEELRAELKVAEARSDAKTAFLSSMSHEIRTPINAVLGMNEMILRESSEQNILEYAENVRTAGNSLLGIINDILDFSKIEAGKMDIVPVEYQLSSVLNDLVNMIKIRADKKGLELHVQVNPDIPGLLFGDEIRIKQIITNILTNAVKYTEKGSVTLEFDFEKLSEEEAALRVRVADTGIGIKQEDIDKLFSVFERIEEERNRNVEGTGLGMNITQQLLNMMDSQLEVESVYGEGSVFSFSLKQKVISWEPVGDYKEALKRSIAQREKYQTKFIAPDAHILVVDDTPMNLVVVQNLLKETQIQLDTAASGRECIDKALKNDYDIIFLDYRMPEMDGIETLEHLREEPAFMEKEVPVICLTANAVSGAREKYLSVGFSDYLTKPINSDRLENMLVKYLPEEKLMESTGAANTAAEPAGTGHTGTGYAGTGRGAAEASGLALPDWLIDTEGLDTAKGVRHCGTAEAYLEALHIFLAAIKENADEIEAYYTEQNWQDYTTKVHALKSTARIVGAEELSKRAERLENAGNAKDVEQITANTGELLSLYRDYENRLEPLNEGSEGEENEAGRAGGEKGKELPPIAAEELSEAWLAIREMAASFDYDSVQMILKSVEGYSLPAEEEQAFTEVKAALRNADWEKLGQIADRKCG